MANILEKYQDITDGATIPVGGAADNAERQHTLSKKEQKILKRIAKALRKHNKLLKQEIRQREAEKKAAETSDDTRKRAESKKVFFSDLGREICKALPKIIVAVATGVLGFMFKSKSFGKSPKTA